MIDAPQKLMTDIGCGVLYKRQYKSILGDLLAAKHKPGMLKASKAEVFPIESTRWKHITYIRKKTQTHLVSALRAPSFPTVFWRRLF